MIKTKVSISISKEQMEKAVLDCLELMGWDSKRNFEGVLIKSEDSGCTTTQCIYDYVVLVFKKRLREYLDNYLYTWHAEICVHYIVSARADITIETEEI